MKLRLSMVLAALGATVATALFFAGCEGADKGDSNAKVGINFSGTYKKGSASITSPAKDPSVTEMTISQSGTALDAVDNNGDTYEGSLGEVPGEGVTEVPFSLRGVAGSGSQANINGTLRQLSPTSAQLDGNWIEPTFSGSISATAAITPVPVVNTNPPVTIVITNAPAETNRFPRFPR